MMFRSGYRMIWLWLAISALAGTVSTSVAQEAPSAALFSVEFDAIEELYLAEEYDRVWPLIQERLNSPTLSASTLK